MSKRRFILLGKLMLALVVLCSAFLLFERIRGQIALASYKKELIAKGERLSPQDFVRQFSESENGAPQVISAIERLQPGMILPANPPPRMRLTPSGRAIVCFREPEWVEQGTSRDGKWRNEIVTNQWEWVAMDLKSNMTALLEIRTALEKPVLINQLDYAAGPKLRLPHLSNAKTLTTWLPGEIQLALREDRATDAIAALRCLICLPKLLAEDQVLISELLRMAISAIAKTDTWEALQRDHWSDEDLDIVQKAWESQHFARGMVRSLECELMALQITHDRLRTSNDETYQLFEMAANFASLFEEFGFGEDETEGVWGRIPFVEELTAFARKQIYCRIWRFAWSHQAELRDLKMVHQILESMREAEATRSYEALRSGLKDFEQAARTVAIYDRLRFSLLELAGAYAKAITRTMRAETDRSVTVCAIALKRHQLRSGKLPISLDALVPEFLTAIPVDYMDGKPVKYRQNIDGGFTLYSVGENGTDDDGDATLLPDRTSYRDLWARKDFVWPQPALPEEVEAWRSNVDSR